MQAFNPYLPNYEYVPDGEPHVFDGRLYIFGSHDRFGAKSFCLNDYVAWSAPVDDLGNWRFEGTIYKKTQDPENANGEKTMFAPDVAKGPDGRYYLYYGLANQRKVNVAVCDSPAGQYEYFGCVVWPDGTPWGQKEGEYMPFDPGVLVDDDGRIHLYAGQGPMFHHPTPIQPKKDFNSTAWHVELEPDMKTMRSVPNRLLPNCTESKGTGFEMHEFFEANSIRKFGEKYYFIYSSVQSHELVYAMSDRPDGGFKYCGTLHSNGDIGIDEFFPVNFFVRPTKKIKAYIGNNHGSIVEIDGRYFIFGHRHTNASMFSRQGVAEEINMNPDGTFDQAEMTSCGLNKGPLRGIGEYSASIACNLQGKKGAAYSFFWPQTKAHPRLTQDGDDREADPGQYIANLKDGAMAGFKYFDFETECPDLITLQIRGHANGTLFVYDSTKCRHIAAAVQIKADTDDWTACTSKLEVSGDKAPLFMRYKGKGSLDLKSFEFKKEDMVK